MKMALEKGTQELAKIGLDVQEAVNRLSDKYPEVSISGNEIESEVDSLHRDAMGWIEKNRPLSAQRRLNDARNLIRDESERNPQNVNLLTLRGYVEKSQGQVYLLKGEVNQARKALNLAANYFNAAYKADAKDPNALNGLANMYFYAEDYDAAACFSTMALEKSPYYAEALWDLALALEEKLKRGDSAKEILPHLVPCYERLANIIPQYPGFTAYQLKHVLTRLSQLKGVSELAKRSDSSSILSALTPDLQRNIERSISKFSEYLQVIGAASVTPVGIKITHDLIKNQGTMACYRIDGTTPFVEVDAQFADEQDLVLRPYMHHILHNFLKEGDRTRKVPSSLDLLESGLAAYFPCSFKGNPHFAPSVPHSEYWNLKNDTKITDLDLANPYAKFGEAIPIWGGVFWELRDTIGQETADKILLKTWVALASRDDLAREQVASQFASVLLDIDTKEEAGQNSAQIKRILTNRGFL